jgi:hypothetical protein
MVGNITEVHGKTGWVIKYKGTRETRKQICGTIKYELDHCGIPQSRKGRSIVSPITWFGSASYNKKLKVPKLGQERCPECGLPLTWIKWTGQGDHPCSHLEEGIYKIDPGGWDYVEIEIRGKQYR